VKKSQSLRREDLESLLARWCGGDATALETLLEICYRSEFTTRANALLRKGNCRSLLEPGDLVHQVYLRLGRLTSPDFVNVDAFFGYVRKQMEQVLIDFKRAEKAKKRGGEATIVSLHIADREED